MHLCTESWPDFLDLYAVKIKCLLGISAVSFSTAGTFVFVKLGIIDMNGFQIWRLYPL